jgi:hypothetical protein
MGRSIHEHAIYQHPLTHTFALLALPTPFVDGDTLAITDVDRSSGSARVDRCVAPVPFAQLTMEAVISQIPDKNEQPSLAHGGVQ